MLPGLGEGFVIAVLRHYGMRTEVVVNALLEGTLPSSLDELSRDLKVPPQRGGNAAAPTVQQQTSGGGRRTDTLGKKLALKEESAVLSDLSAPGRRAPKAVLEAASVDPVAADLAAAQAAGGGGADGDGLYKPPTVVHGASLGLYEDEFDDSLEAYSAEARTTGPALQEDLEYAASTVRRGGQGIGASLWSGGGGGDGPGGMPGGGGGGGSMPMPSSSSSSSSSGLPANAIEWIRSIGLGQYAEKLRSSGLVRLELAARITEEECDKMKMTGSHKTKLLASAQRLGERLKERGRKLPGGSGGGGGSGAAEQGGEVYAAAAQIHFDAETGQWWDESGGGAEGGEVEGGGGGPSEGRGGGGKGGGRGPINPALARRRNEANKAKVANHSRKQGAARKFGKGGFVG